MLKVNFRLYVITSRLLCKRKSLTQIVDEACQAGVKAVQLREKDLPARAIYNLAKDLQESCQKTASKLFINDRFDIAKAVVADGVHLTSNGLPVEVVRKHFDSGKLIGVSTHTLEEAKSAEKAGADLISFGPIYHTLSKAAYGEPQGLDKLQAVACSVEIPVFAIGGITPERAGECIKRGAFGVAVISSLMSTPDIPSTVKNYEKHLKKL